MKTLAFLIAFTATTTAADAKPNLVVLFSDDAGYADFGFQPHVRPEMKTLTPHIDSIAANGARCSNAYVSGSVCSPSRAGLMTGRYQQRFGHDNNLPPGFPSGLPLTETFGAKRLRALGYRTGLVGKWHLGYPAAYHPNRRGFDWFYGLLQGSRSYFPYRMPHPYRVLQENGKPTPEKGYVTDRIGDAACRFIRENRDRPFYLFVSFTSPHGPLQPKMKDFDALSGIKAARRRKYAGLIKSLDDNVGKILNTLHGAGLQKNTLLVFTNDNGGQTLTGANNFPLKGRKGTLWEGGIRVPWAVQWPGKIKAGTVIDDPVISLDLLPTFIAAAGGTVKPEWKLDGVNLLPRLTGQVKRLPIRTLHWRRRGPGGPITVREGDWKLIYNRGTPDARPELYRLSTDVGETKDLAAAEPKITATLLEKAKAWEAKLKKPLWGPQKRKKRRNKRAKT
jgi:arylsulfatase A-like enzyme